MRAIRHGWRTPRACFVIVPLLLATPSVVHAQAPAPTLTIVDAARVTISGQPDILLQQQQVNFNRGTLGLASSLFDPRVTASFSRGRDELPFTLAQKEQAQGLFDSTVTNITSYRVGVEKQFRSGFLLSPSVEMQRQDLNFEDLSPNRAVVSIVGTLPLLRGRSRDVVTATERAARSDVFASELDLQHTAAGAVARTAQAYWTYVAATRRLAVLVDAETRARTLVGEMQALIDGGNRPAAEIRQVQANLADRVAQRAFGEQSLVEARHGLGLAMGITIPLIETLAPPADDFPALSDDEALNVVAVERLVRGALQRRRDLEAVATRQTSATTLREQARDALQPQVNLVTALGYAGIDEGNEFWKLMTPLAPSGFNISTSLVVDWATLNNRALGTLARSEAAYQQTTIQRQELARTIGSNVAVAADGVRRSATRVRSAREAAALYTAAVDDERQKLQIGLSTIIDLILTEDRLTQSLVSEVEASLGYAQAVTRLRFEAGSLIDEPSDGSAPTAGAIDRLRLTTVPLAAP